MIDWRDRISIIGAVIISIIVTGGFMIVCIAVFFLEIKNSMQQLANILFGGLLTAFVGVVQYWTGSTSGSQKKDAMLAAASLPSDVPGVHATISAAVATPTKPSKSKP